MTSVQEARQQLQTARTQVDMQRQLVESSRLQAQSAALPGLGQTQLRGRGVMGLIKRKIQQSQLEKQRGKALQKISAAEQEISGREEQLGKFEGAIQSVEAQQRAIAEARQQQKQYFKYQSGQIGASQLEPGIARALQKRQAQQEIFQERMEDVVQRELGMSYSELIDKGSFDIQTLSPTSLQALKGAGIEFKLPTTQTITETAPLTEPGTVSLLLKGGGGELATTGDVGPLQLDLAPGRGAVDLPDSDRLRRLKELVGADQTGFDVDKFTGGGKDVSEQPMSIAPVYGPQQMLEVEGTLTPYTYKPTYGGTTEWQNLLSGSQMSALQQPGSLWKPIMTDERGVKTGDPIYFGDTAIAYHPAPTMSVKEPRLWRSLYDDSQTYSVNKLVGNWEEVKTGSSWLQRNIVTPTTSFLGGSVGMNLPYLDIIDPTGVQRKVRKEVLKLGPKLMTGLERGYDVIGGKVFGEKEYAPILPSYVPQKVTMGGDPWTQTMQYKGSPGGKYKDIFTEASMLGTWAGISMLPSPALLGLGGSLALSDISTPAQRFEGLAIFGFGAYPYVKAGAKQFFVPKPIATKVLGKEIRISPKETQFQPYGGKPGSISYGAGYRPGEVAWMQSPYRKYVLKKPPKVKVLKEPVEYLEELKPLDYLATKSSFLEPGKSYISVIKRGSKAPWGLKSQEELAQAVGLLPYKGTGQARILAEFKGTKIAGGDFFKGKAPKFTPTRKIEITDVGETKYLGRVEGSDVFIGEYSKWPLWKAGKFRKKATFKYGGSEYDLAVRDPIERYVSVTRIKPKSVQLSGKPLKFYDVASSVKQLPKGKPQEVFGELLKVEVKQLPKFKKFSTEYDFVPAGAKRDELFAHVSDDSLWKLTTPKLKFAPRGSALDRFDFTPKPTPVSKLVPKAPKAPLINPLIGVPRMVGGAGLTDVQLAGARAKGGFFTDIDVVTTRDFVSPSVVGREFTLLGAPVKTDTAIKPKIKLKDNLIFKTQLKLKDALRPLEKFKTTTKVKDLLKFKPAQKTVLRDALRFKQAVRQVVRPATTTRITTRRPRPPLKPPRKTEGGGFPIPKPSDGVLRRVGRKSPPLGLFIPEVRRYGKFQAIGKPTTFFKAKRKGKKKVRETLGASLRIRRAKTGEIIPLAAGGVFRPAKREAGVLVQRRGARLSDPFEVKEIKQARRRRQFGL